MTKTAPVRWDRHTIKAEVHRAGTTLTAIAIAAGLDPSACRSALVRRHIAGEAALAAYLGVAVEILWPERYRRPSPWAKRILDQQGAASQNETTHADMGAAA
ncbi:MAG: helix-turn-helix domain-containing protein [Pseudomonadota bacterium]